MAFFDADKLRRFLRYPADQPIHADDAQLAEEVAAGWLSEPIGRDPREIENPPPAIVSWMIELAGIAYENPTSMETDTSQDTSSGWRDRRAQILASARAWAREQAGNTRTVALPKGSFPPAQPWGRW